MSSPIVVYKNMTTVITAKLNMDLSGEPVPTSQIRSGPDHEAPLIAEWQVAFATDGTDGELVLTLDDAISAQVTAASGYMDIRRIANGEPLPVFERPLEVVFQGTVSA